MPCRAASVKRVGWLTSEGDRRAVDLRWTVSASCPTLSLDRAIVGRRYWINLGYPSSTCLSAVSLTSRLGSPYVIIGAHQRLRYLLIRPRSDKAAKPKKVGTRIRTA